MVSRFRLNRMDVFGLISVVVTTLLFMGPALYAANLYTSVRPMSAGERVIGYFGWLIATFGPMILATLFWRWSKIFRKRWSLHLLMLPVALAMFKLGTSLMLSVIGSSDFDDTIGGPVIQARVLFVLAVIGYHLAFLYTAFKDRSGASNGS